MSVLLKKELIDRFCGEAFVSTLLLLVVHEQAVGVVTEWTSAGGAGH